MSNVGVSALAKHSTASIERTNKRDKPPPPLAQDNVIYSELVSAYERGHKPNEEELKQIVEDFQAGEPGFWKPWGGCPQGEHCTLTAAGVAGAGKLSWQGMLAGRHALPGGMVQRACWVCSALRLPLSCCLTSALHCVHLDMCNELGPSKSPLPQAASSWPGRR